MIVTISGPARKKCPYKDEDDEGTAVITLDLGWGEAPELHDLAARLKTDEQISHEAFTEDLHAWLSNLSGGVASAHVRTTWNTAGLEVTVDVPDRSR